jgi:NNP family nitrate/nitrite transporter-like MFS transporter
MDSRQVQNKDDQRQNNGTGSFRSQLGPLLFLTWIFFLNFTGRIIFSPLMPAIEADLGLDHAEAGSLFLLISIGYFVSLSGSGFLSSRINHRKSIIISAIAVGAALLGVASCGGLWSMRIALLLVGLSAGIYFPSGIATVTSLSHPRHWGKALAIHELAPNMGFVAAPLISEALMLWFSWRGVLAFLGCGSLAAGIVFARLGKGGDFPGESPSLGSSRALFSRPDFWIMIILFSLGISGTLGVYSMLPLYLVAGHGMDRHWANTLVALSRISGLVMVFLSGWTTDRFGPRRTLSSVFLLSGLMTVLLGAASGAWIVIIIFLQPVIAACFFPPGLAVLSSIGPSGIRNVAISLTIPVAFILGAGAIPMGIGFMGDAGSFSLGFILVGALIFMGSLLSMRLKPSLRGA